MPKYWAGTNCRASGGAQIGEPIYRAELWLNGELVKWWEAPPGSELPLAKGLSVMLDSSHFADNTSVEVTYKVWGIETGLHEEGSDPDPVVKNKLLVAADYELENAEPGGFVSTPWTNRFSTRNYSILGGSLLNWTSANALSLMSTSNVALFSCHGTEWRGTLHVINLDDDMEFEDYIAPYEIQWCYEDGQMGGIPHLLCPHPSPPDPPFYLEFFFTHNVYDNRVQTVGYPNTPQFPPFNSTGNPPLNLVWLDICEGLFWPWYETFLIPHKNAYVGSIEDQALAAWRIKIPAGYPMQELAEIATLHFVAGETVSEVVAHVEEYIFANNLEGKFNFGTLAYSPGDLGMIGDPFTRVKYVYTGSTSIPETGWYY